MFVNNGIIMPASDSVLCWVRQRQREQAGKDMYFKPIFQTQIIVFLNWAFKKKKRSSPLTWSFTFNLGPLRIKITGRSYSLFSMTRRDSVCKEERTQSNRWVLYHRQPRTALPQAHTHTVPSCLFPTPSCF